MRDRDEIETLSLEHEFHNLANDYYKIGEFDKAVEYYNKALELRPDLLETYFNRGLAYTRKQNYDKAIEDLSKVIELNPNLAEAYYTRGLVYEYKQDYDKAIENYARALDVDPNYSKAQSQKEVAKNKKETLAAAKSQAGGGAPGGGGVPQTQTTGGEEGKEKEEFTVLERPKTRFKDVAGLEKTKEKLLESIVYPLMKPELAKKYGKTPGGGVLFYGPPGTGKTFIGKAAAGETGAAFLNVKISDIVDMYAGNTEKNIHKVFETARKNRPAILFFDEIDGMGGRRDSMQQSFERRSINQFLMEMDGAEYSNEGILVVGATNAPWDVDPALRRSGRFSKMIYFPEPDKQTREGILKINLKNRPIDPKISLSRLARMTEGYSSADMKALCDAAAAIPWKEEFKTGKGRYITFKDFVEAAKEVKSSLPAWYSSCRQYVIEEEEDEEDGKKKGRRKSESAALFRELIDTSAASKTSYDGSSTTTVKHKKAQEKLLGEEERQLFDDLIKDVQKLTEPTNQMLRKTRVLIAKYVM